MKAFDYSTTDYLQEIGIALDRFNSSVKEYGHALAQTRY
jgi:hypothetical protein